MHLDQLRNEIARLDRQILELVAERVSVARSIGELKMERGLPVRNLEVEEKVLKRHLDIAIELGLNPRAVRDISRVLIQEAIEEQASLPRPEERQKNIMIIGGAGKMGRWMTNLLSSCGHIIHVMDPKDGGSCTLEDAADMDVVMVSAPISKVDGLLQQLDGLTGEKTLIFDISSLKSPFTETLRRMAASKKVCSVHPMFGPSARSMYDRNLLLCDCGCQEAVDEAKELFDDHGARMTVIPLEEHDRYMSYVLGMSHAVNIAFFTAVERSGVPLEEFERMASTTFLKHLDTARSVASEDPDLYHEIQHLNQKSHDSWEAFSNAVAMVKDASLREEPSAFRAIMERGRRYFQP